MNKLNYIFPLFIAIILLGGCSKNSETDNLKLTSINPLSYTDVAFVSIKDTVIVSTYSGRIAKRIKDQKEEEIITQLDDEIYALAYSKERNEIIASTLTSGIIILNGNTGEVLQTLKTEDSWINNISLSKDEIYIVGFDQSGKNYVWDVSKDYELINYPESFPRSYARFIDDSGTIYHSGGGKVVLWNTKSNLMKKELALGGKLVDADTDGNLLLLNHNEFVKFNTKKDTVQFKNKHPNWIFHISAEDTVHTPLQMKLTTARFVNDKIYTAGIDQSIRVWNKENGKHLDNLIGHRATISSIKVSDDEGQLVSVDLKGGVKFWDLE